MGEWIHAKATCQEGIDTFIQRVASKNALKSQNASERKEEMVNISDSTELNQDIFTSLKEQLCTKGTS